MDSLFAAAPGWKKPVQLAVKWELLTPEGQLEVEKTTVETAANAEEMMPDTPAPRYADIFVELARGNATAFAEFIAP